MPTFGVVRPDEVSIDAVTRSHNLWLLVPPAYFGVSIAYPRQVLSSKTYLGKMVLG